MAKAIEMVRDKEFISEQDTDGSQTTWLLRTLSGLEFIRATGGGYVDHDYILTTGITGWKDFPDDSGKEVEFSVANINLIPPLILQDISFELQEMSGLGESERKNS